MKIKSFASKQPWIWSAIGIVLLWAIISVISGKISTDTLFMNVTLASFTFLLGIAEMMVITSGDGALDLSLPYTMTICAYIAAATFRDGNTWKGILILLAVCVGIGLLNGLINVYLHVHAMIGTLAVGYIIFTVILEYSKVSTKAPTKEIQNFVHTRILGISVLTILCLLFAVIMFIVMYKTKLGKSIHAVGQGHLIAYLAGINVNRLLILIFVCSSLIAGLTGVLVSAYVGGSYQTLGDSYLIPSIAATMVGGTLISGGKSCVPGVFTGAVMFVLLNTLLNLSGFSAGLQRIVEGVVIILILFSAKKDTN